MIIISFLYLSFSISLQLLPPLLFALLLSVKSSIVSFPLILLALSEFVTLHSIFYPRHVVHVSLEAILTNLFFCDQPAREKFSNQKRVWKKKKHKRNFTSFRSSSCFLFPESISSCCRRALSRFSNAARFSSNLSVIFFTSPM
jgi:hypothetical protein